MCMVVSSHTRLPFLNGEYDGAVRVNSPATTLALNQPVQFVKGVGPKKGDALSSVGIATVCDLLMYVPRRYLDRTTVATIAQARAITLTEQGTAETDFRREVTVLGDVRSFRVLGAGRKARFLLILGDATGSLQCVWFGGVHYWKTRFKVGDRLAVSGQPSLFGAILQLVHPDVDWIEGKDEEEPGASWSRLLHGDGLIPLYASSQELTRVGLDSGGFRRLLMQLIRQHADSLTDPLPQSLRQRHQLLPLGTAIRNAHFPKTDADIREALRRLKYQELFEFQVKLALQRNRAKQESGGIAFAVQSTLARQFVDALPFTLTASQVKVLKEILEDMKSPHPMHRLLQGDVGSGKTVVALAAMLVAVDNGYQALFVAPTEILAEQHFRTMRAFLGALPVRHRLLVGAQRSGLRRDVLGDIRSGAGQIIVGTHAVFEDEVVFSRLGMVVIDEQHRFGVLQRARVRAKGDNPDVLIMTATPIPRTLSLTLYGDLDVSVIAALPSGRRPVRTLLKFDDEKEGVYGFVREQVAAGRQAYFVYPLIEESEVMDLKAATVHVAQLQEQAFPDLRVGLLHGRLTSDEKDAVMGQFLKRELDILVATTVIEVGIDVPNATVMVIENAERFGLSQLHQLRGRVGRGSDQSYCILVTERWVAQRARRAGKAMEDRASLEQYRAAEQRLATMVRTNDGFAIAEADLALRGPGDFFGTRQSGVPEFRVANPVTDVALLTLARDDAFALVGEDPHLRRDDHRTLADHLRSRFQKELVLMQTG
jgi:ATP-dependent DNA helicase RecG